jgi:hypothetical protein
MTDYIRDLRPAKWSSVVKLHSSNREARMSAMGQSRRFDRPPATSDLP